MSRELRSSVIERCDYIKECLRTEKYTAAIQAARELMDDLKQLKAQQVEAQQ